MVDSLLDAGNRLEMFPRIGRPAPSKQEPYARELIVGEYIIKYRVISDDTEREETEDLDVEALNEIVEILAVVPARARH